MPCTTVCSANPFSSLVIIFTKHKKLVSSNILIGLAVHHDIKLGQLSGVLYLSYFYDNYTLHNISNTGENSIAFLCRESSGQMQFGKAYVNSVSKLPFLCVYMNINSQK